MSKWMEKVRKKREAREDVERQKLADERRHQEEIERKRRQQDNTRRFYEITVAKKLEDKKREAELESQVKNRHQQMEDAQRIRHQQSNTSDFNQPANDDWTT